MPIEFQCQSCSKPLRVPDAAAGKRAKCPSCQQVNSVPAASTASAAPIPPAPVMPVGGNPYAADPNQGQPGMGANPYATPGVASRGPASQLASGSVGLQASQAVSTAWMLFKEHMGLLIGCVVVLSVVNQIFSVAQQVTQVVVAGPPKGPQGFDGSQLLTVYLVALLFFPFTQAVQTFLTIGLIRIQLCIARGQQTSFGMLFSGGGRFLKAYLATLLFTLMFLLGLLALIVPGIYLMLRYWTYLHFIVDKDCGIMESFSLAGAASKNNLGETFVLGLIGFGLCLLGLVMLCIGIFFTAPVVYLSMTIAYLMMTSQRYRQTARG